MGDRVLIQIHSKAEGDFSPVIYGHWSGDAAPAAMARLRERMKGRTGDVSYTTARALQELMGNMPDGNLGFGVWNAPALLTAEDSHGDAGVILVNVDGPELTFECLGGYLVTTAPTGLPSVPA